LRRQVSWFIAPLAVACFSVSIAGQALAPEDLELLAKALERPVALLKGEKQAFTATLTARYRDGTGELSAEVRIVRADAGRFGLALKSPLLSFELVREAEATRLVVPLKKVAIVGKGPMPPDSELNLGTLLPKMAAPWPHAPTAIGVLQAADAGAVAALLYMVLSLERAPGGAAGGKPPTFVGRRALSKGRVSIELSADGNSINRLRWRRGNSEATVAVSVRDEVAMPKAATAGLKVVSAPRGEVELLLARALARGSDILCYNERGFRARDEVRRAGRGRLVVKKGRRLAVLQGTPYEIGFQHGKLLGREARRVSEAVLYVVGLAYTIEKGEWFLDAMRGAFARLKPHIPREYLDEMKGLADGAQVPLETVHLANAFPALFHCSGFALFGKATVGGKLYHGRVLDYMTEVGLQRDAVVFVVKKEGAIPFANIGYAGFIGSVSGMNAEQVAFGEMGGGGKGLWDGTPMAILMRMGLERARTLEDACRIFREARRTCEYYYVISDGKIPSAVGVAATPDKIEFFRPGQAHPSLPTPMEDGVLLSTGRRYERLVERVKARYGQIDAEAAMALMRRPVAMRSNLHNVLFVPQDLVFYVADARGRSPACDQRYARYDLRALLAGTPKPPAKD